LINISLAHTAPAIPQHIDFDWFNLADEKFPRLESLSAAGPVYKSSFPATFVERLATLRALRFFEQLKWACMSFL
jgi:hypothetical protein